jgi:hypothetical protein
MNRGGEVGFSFRLLGNQGEVAMNARKMGRNFVRMK